MARIHLLRHACAGHKDDWEGDDERRPLDEAGMRQADALAEELLREEPVHRLVSSPPDRCVQSLQPLAARTGLRIELADRLRADADPDEVAELIVSLDEGTVLCTHGELMRPLLDRWRAARVAIESARPDDDEFLLGKGTAWTLEVDGGRVRRLRHHAPMPVADCPTHPGSA
jgi:8-oxo-dGTP diphosphatase